MCSIFFVFNVQIIIFLENETKNFRRYFGDYWACTITLSMAVNNGRESVVNRVIDGSTYPILSLCLLLFAKN
jgi:hypothetical protein